MVIICYHIKILHKQKNGLTFTNNGDGTLLINGTASVQTIYCINAESIAGTIADMRLEATNYKITVGQTMSNSTFFVQLAYRKPDTTMNYISITSDGGTTGNLSILDSNNNAGFGLIIRKDTSFDNVLIKPMLQLATTSYDFEPYTGGTPSPNPDYPQNIKVVTGENTIHIGNITKTLNLGNIELAKIGDYSDLIFKNEKSSQYYNSTLTENAWYKKEIIGKKILSDITGWAQGNPSNRFVAETTDKGNTSVLPLCTHLIGGTLNSHDNVGGLAIQNLTNTIRFNCYVQAYASNVNGFKSWIASAKPISYYVLEESKDILITDTTLINQLEEINSIIGTGGTVVIETESGNENAQLIVNASALASFENS